MSQKAQQYPVWVPSMREDTEDESPLGILKKVVARLTVRRKLFGPQRQALTISNSLHSLRRSDWQYQNLREEYT